MCPMTRYPMWKSLLSPFRRSQQKTLALVIAAIAEAAQATSLAVAGHLAVRLGIQLGRAWNRLDRLLRNPRIDDQVLTAQRLRLLGAGRRLRIALDGTEGHHDLQMRVASGDPGPGGGLSQDADVPVAEYMGARVPKAARPHPAGGRPSGGPPV
ncbi:hypothetical protein HRbin11_00473 [bacterium HR11]|nr:hypothetical protein HRbin11_00473 [bacterium HR11]